MQVSLSEPSVPVGWLPLYGSEAVLAGGPRNLELALRCLRSRYNGAIPAYLKAMEMNVWSDPSVSDWDMGCPGWMPGWDATRDVGPVALYRFPTSTEGYSG